MNFSIADFTQVARSNWFNNDIVLSKDGSRISSKFFHTKSSNPSAKVTNDATREAFREALVTEFGAFGQKAFEQLLLTRGEKSLRKNDILNAVKAAKACSEAENVLAMAEETLGTILRNKSLPYCNTSTETQTLLRENTLSALTEMMEDEASQKNILRELKFLPKNFDTRMTILAKKAFESLPTEDAKFWVKADEILGTILRDKDRPYHALSKADHADLRKETLASLKEMMGNEASKENILREIKRPSSMKFFEARMAVLVKEAAKARI